MEPSSEDTIRSAANGIILLVDVVFFKNRSFALKIYRRDIQMNAKKHHWLTGGAILLIAGLASVPIAAQEKVSPKIKQEKVPPEVQKNIDETMNGQHGLYNFEGNKAGLGFSSSTKLSDLKAGVPFKVYKISRDSLEKLGENVSVSEIANPLPIWEVPVFQDGKCVTTFEVWKTPKKPQWHAGIFNGCTPEWQKVIDAWPDSQGYHPIIIYMGSVPKYYHVPEKDDSNLTPLYRHPSDSLDGLADKSYKILLSSKFALRYEKAHLHPKNNGGVK